MRQRRAIKSRAGSRPDLALIACPTLIPFARQDGVVSLYHRRGMRTAISGAPSRVVETPAT